MTGDADLPTSDDMPGRDPDWSFSFGDGDERAGLQPPVATVDGLEFAKNTLQHEIAGVMRTSLHLQSLLRRAYRDGMTVDALAVHAGLSRESVEAVLAGASLVDQLFGTGSAPNSGRPEA